MSAPAGPTPDRVMQIVTGGWAAAILGSAAQFGIFNTLENGGGTAETVAQQAGVSQRGAQALLDGLTGVGLLTLTDGRYYNTPDASAFLIKGKPSYFGGMAEMFSHELRDWAKLGDAVKTGQPAASITTDVPNNEFWQKLVPAIAALSFPVAQIAAERLGLARAGAVRWLDVGGGSGVWSAVWLQANPRGAAYQLDWPVVNTIAKDFVAGFGVADRFHAIDGDFHEKDFGDAAYDYAIYAHIAHQETPEDNVAVFRKFRRALKPGGTLVINDFVLADDRTGPAFAMLFASQMLLGTKGGFTWRHSDYRSWLTESGFTSVEIVPTPTPATLVFAK